MAVTTARTMVRKPHADFYLAAASAGGDVMLTLTADECEKYDTFLFLSPIGAITVEVEAYPGGGWSNAVALQDMAGTLIDQNAATTNLNLFGLVGRFAGVRVKASGGAASVNLACSSMGRKP